MSSKQRVFSHNNTINYHDYTQNKNGIILLKNAKNKCENQVLNKFINYNQFITMTKSYYKYLNNEYVDIPPTDLYNSNTSFILYEKYLEHCNNCNLCRNNKNYINTKCKEINNILYPYGNIITQKQSNIYYPYKLNLTCWCNNNSTSNLTNHTYMTIKNIEKKCGDCNSDYEALNVSKWSEELCKTRKKLFI